MDNKSIPSFLPLLKSGNISIEALQRMDAKHNDVVVEIFKKLEIIGLNVNTMQTEIRLVIGRTAQ